MPPARSPLVGAAGHLATAIVWLSVAAPASAEWRRVETPNFVVIGEVGAGDLREIAVRFEAFREALSRILAERSTSTAVPTIVIVFPSERAFTPYMPLFQGKTRRVGGLFVPRRDVNYIALIEDGRPNRINVVFHEYAHLVVSNVTRAVPLWLSEGLAEYYSTFELSRNRRQAVIGAPVERHLARFAETALMPMDDLLTMTQQSPLYNENDRRSIFYGQSWALTHLILLGEPNRTRELGVYLERLSRGRSSADAWRDAFGAADLAAELQRYVRRNTFRAVEYTFADRLASLNPPVAVMPPAEAQAVLADYLVQQRRLDEASRHLDQAVKIDASSAVVKTATLLFEIASDRLDEARSRVATLGTLADWLTAYLAGTAVAQLGERTGQAASAQDVETARRLFASASASHGEIPNAIARMAALELRSEGGLSAGMREALDRARTQVPGRHDYTLLYAQVLARQNDFAGARAALLPLDSWTVPAPMRDSARSLREFIDRREAAVNAAAAAAAARGRPGDPARPPGGAPPPPAGEPITRPIFRTLQNGEVRVEGQLERIECVRGTGVVFQVKTPDGPFTASAPQFADVDFITYRTDLAGAIDCGPLEEPLAVYLTWKPGGAKAEAKRVVAIEFLPKR